MLSREDNELLCRVGRGTPMGELLAEAAKRNEHCGHFYASLAETFDRVRRYPAATSGADES